MNIKHFCFFIALTILFGCSSQNPTINQSEEPEKTFSYIGTWQLTLKRFTDSTGTVVEEYATDTVLVDKRSYFNNGTMQQFDITGPHPYDSSWNYYLTFLTYTINGDSIFESVDSLLDSNFIVRYPDSNYLINISSLWTLLYPPTGYIIKEVSISSYYDEIETLNNLELHREWIKISDEPIDLRTDLKNAANHPLLN
jgi:hypothetical protein